MIFSERLLFIHIGKTGGMSCSDYLLRSLTGPVWNCHQEADHDQSRLSRKDITSVAGLNRHCTLEAASRFLKENFDRRLEDFDKIVAVFRHPYSLEYSWYRHLQKPDVRERRRAQGELLELAQGDFEEFVRGSGYHRRGLTQERYVQIGGHMPPNVSIVRFENLGAEFLEQVRTFTDVEESNQGDARFPLLNSTVYEVELDSVLTSSVKSAIQSKHPFVFETGFYAR
ncbi:MAG: hypothetical protein AAF671_12260 [Pseudomonadota bacterium]